MYVGVRTAGDPAALLTPIRAAIRELDAELPLDAVGTVDDLVTQTLSPRRFSLLLMVIFATLALILAMVGIYGVMAYSVNQATQEIGIRIALGARSGNVLRIVLTYGGVLMAALDAYLAVRDPSAVLVNDDRAAPCNGSALTGFLRRRLR